MDPAGHEAPRSRADKGNHVAVLGAALSANKGAASMLLALVDHIDEILPGGVVKNLSTYPEADRLVNRNDRLEIVSYTPAWMLLVNLPLALLIGLSRLLRTRGRVFARTTALRALIDASVVADLAGISFSDGRGIPTLVYNTLMTGIPMLVGVPVVKCSQAIGPIESTSTRIGARLVLPRLRAIVARGERTYRHLIDFGLSNVEEGSDFAFLMGTRDDDQASAKEMVSPLDGQAYFVVSPSSVVEALCGAEGIDYIGLMVEVIEELIANTGLSAVLIAHSARPGQGPGRMNDLPVCREIAARCSPGKALFNLDGDLDPRVLRGIIAGGRFLLASRFHAMISGLATGTPTVVVGWSHKYREVMNEFALERFVLPFSDFTTTNVLGLALDANDAHDSIADQINSELPKVTKSSMVSVRALMAAMEA